MTDRPSRLHTQLDDASDGHDGNDYTVSPSSSRVSPIDVFSPSSLFQRSGYQLVTHNDAAQQTPNFHNSASPPSYHQPPPPLPSSYSPPPQLPPIPSVSSSPPGPDSLGIAMQPGPGRSPMIRKPVGGGGGAGRAGSGSVASPEGPPRSVYGLLDADDADRSTLSSPLAVSPQLGRGLPPSSHQHARISSQSSYEAGARGLGPGPGHVMFQASPDMAADSTATSTPRNDIDDMTPAESTDAPNDKLQVLGDPESGGLGDDFDDEKFYKGFESPPSYCYSREDIQTKRTSWLSLTVYVLSIYSTIGSAIWLVVAFVQPRWGHGISSRYGLNPSTATTIVALLAKTIEMSFVTTFISCLGQVLTRRSFIRNSQGMTLAEITMRNWVIQPGSLITHGETVPTAALTILGALTLTATIAATFYTTASDAMIAPKLKYGDWEAKALVGRIQTSYANAEYTRITCPALLMAEDEDHAAESCMNVQFSGASYRNLLNLMSTWTAIKENGTVVTDDWYTRPVGTTLLWDNTTMVSSWIETEHSDVEAQFDRNGRIINNVTMAMPHPGVYSAATNEVNGILQPDDLAGVGEYRVRAGVVSPSINVMCVNMDADELEPLVYTAWRFANSSETGVGDQLIGEPGWQDDVPVWTDDDKGTEYLNRTVVDDIFKWGPEYDRRPPVFQLYPADNQLIFNASVYKSDAVYIMGKSPRFDNYTLCELRSWVSPNCSTRFDISGTGGALMEAHCEDPSDRDSYLAHSPDDTEFAPPVQDWKLQISFAPSFTRAAVYGDKVKANPPQWIAQQWGLSMDLNGGTYNNNASNARILTQLALEKPSLPTDLPSLAEALAVYASSTLLIGSIDSPFVHYWDQPETILEGRGMGQSFNASLRTQQYTSGHVDSWQSIFYVVLLLVFAINIFCLVYFILRSGLVTDFTEPQNLFALAINSPPSKQLKGSCGGGPQKRDLVVPWRVAFAPSANHYFFEEANEGPWKPWKGKFADDRAATGTDYATVKGISYKRLSARKGWLL